VLSAGRKKPDCLNPLGNIFHREKSQLIFLLLVRWLRLLATRCRGAVAISALTAVL
jgi:hypothetical protein